LSGTSLADSFQERLDQLAFRLPARTLINGHQSLHFRQRTKGLEGLIFDAPPLDVIPIDLRQNKTRMAQGSALLNRSEMGVSRTIGSA
jgi:hypothetical protein